MNNYPYIKYVIGNINKNYYASTNPEFFLSEAGDVKYHTFGLML